MSNAEFETYLYISSEKFIILSKRNTDKEYFLSIIEPSEWNQTYVGTFKSLNSGKWEKINA